jgi:hypothetical protein
MELCCSVLQYLLILILLITAGYFKGRMDAIAHSRLNNFDWEKKYDFTKDGNYNHWWYFGLVTPRFPEKFPFSSTALVFLTDAWHKYQFLTLHCFYLAIAIGITKNIWVILLLSFIIFPLSVGAFFEYSYNKFRKQ